jgi:hypothetical protein
MDQVKIGGVRSCLERSYLVKKKETENSEGRKKELELRSF